MSFAQFTYSSLTATNSSGLLAADGKTSGVFGVRSDGGVPKTRLLN